MRRRLVLMRHAKSSWKSDALTDHERPLKKRGRKAAPKVGAELKRRGWVPERVLSSDSTRTKETFERMRKALGFDGEAEFSASLYHGGVRPFFGAVSRVPDDVRCLLVLGHNPGWEDVAHWLSGDEIVIKTATAVLMTNKSDSWSDALQSGAWKIESVIHPRDL